MSIKKDNTKNVLSEVDRLIKFVLQNAAVMIERTAKQLCPVKTGTLKRSINRYIEPRRLVVGSNVEYAPYVEIGTRKWKGKPYLRPALEANISKIKSLIKEII